MCDNRKTRKSWRPSHPAWPRLPPLKEIWAGMGSESVMSCVLLVWRCVEDGQFKHVSHLTYEDQSTVQSISDISWKWAVLASDINCRFKLSNNMISLARRLGNHPDWSLSDLHCALKCMVVARHVGHDLALVRLVGIQNICKPIMIHEGRKGQ